MESEVIASTTTCESLATKSYQSTSSHQSIEILGEIVGATNLVAALREENNNEDRLSTPPTTGVSKIDGDCVNAFCNVYWSNEMIHQTKTISKNNNPIWACDSGSLFTIPLRGDVTYYDLKIEVYDRVGRNETSLIGVISIPGETIQDGSICNEKRVQFELHKGGPDSSLRSKESGKFYSTSGVLKSIRRIAPVSMQWLENEDVPPADDEVDEDDSIYGGEKLVDGSERANIDDDYIFGKNGTIALRFRVATKEDIAFLKAVKIYNEGYRYARKKNSEALAGMKQILDGKRLAHIVSERSTSYLETLNCTFMNEFIDYRIFGKLDDAGVQRYRSKPGPDPSRPAHETKFLTLEEMKFFCRASSRNWVEAGSGNLGQIKLEILSCEGLPNKDYGEMFGNLTDPFVCIIYEDCLVQTDVIPDCINPMWLPWTQRAFVFNRMHELSSIYLGIFNHRYGPAQHDGCGRIAIDLSELKTNTIYTMKYELFSSPILTNRKSKGFITLRLQLTHGKKKKENILSLAKPPVMHVNVRRRKTLAIARYTCYGKYREDVYNTRILRSYVDELLEYVVSWSFILKRGMRSLIFWRGQVRIGKRAVPLHSFLAFVTAAYVIEYPNLIPAYIFFCAGWCMFVLTCEQHRHPSPWYRGKSFSHHLRRFISSELITSKGESIDVNEGFKEMKEMEKERQKIAEEDNMLQAQISAVKRELQQILAAVSSVVTIRTNEDVGGLNPLSKLLPVQLIMRDVIHYVRSVHMILSCKDSQLSFLLTILCFGIGVLLLVLPIGKILLWISRLLVWIFLGPWMKLADMTYKRRRTNIDGVNKHVKKIMKEIQGREQKRWMNARILREEALKLKATRILRFGRFAVKVPSINITRFRDHPLSESTARPASDDDKDINDECILRCVPGQKHYGVMIPQLINPKDLNKRRNVSSFMLNGSNGKIKKKRLLQKETLKFGGKSPKREVNLKLGEKEESMRFIVEPAKSFRDGIPAEIEMEEGFELIAATSGSNTTMHFDSSNNDYENESENESISSSEERDQTCFRKIENNNEDTRERNHGDNGDTRDFERSIQDEREVDTYTEINASTSHKGVEIQIERVLSDITES